MAWIFQLHFGTCLWATVALCVFAGSRRQTEHVNIIWEFSSNFSKELEDLRNLAEAADERFHVRDTADTNGGENTDVILELLWGGIEIMDNETIKIEDEELASLRPAKRLLQILQHEIPKNPAGIEEHLDYLSQTDTPITPEEFEQLIFTMVYCAYQVRSIQGLEKNLWINLFSQLVTEIIHELCKQFCPKESVDSVELLASRPWQEMPVYISALKKFYWSSLAMAHRNQGESHV